MKGFSLVEAIVVMVLTAIVLAATVPNWRGMGQRQQLLAYQRLLLQWLQQQQVAAMGSNVATASYAQKGQLVTAQQAVPDARLQPPSAIELSSTYSARLPLQFSREGFARAGHWEITAAGTELRVDIIISSLGRIRVCQRQGPTLQELAPC
ncbi:hypothetical protein CWI84_09290 [Idiomarina tyrosinivorans]|uniref:Prepilin-type N-terminal cleavage/methylation domain-containing protein n=1 Tax=Idiomarina tyrosinivorans TaxID=1445662 RepID=A0A432ZPN2_9GAMM|nr:prepilin-type N-terminal cleavage/methylation domain-containing protein [Idiomarina tyrosinivorans]RUO79812.1 hypothetical protein CWI84_09290 [Idiomarina tyrosinivorans]